MKKGKVKNPKYFKIGFAIGSIPFLIGAFISYLFNQSIFDSYELTGHIVLSVIFGVISGYIMDNLRFNYSKKEKNIRVIVFILLLYLVIFIFLYFWYSLLSSTGLGSFGP